VTSHPLCPLHAAVTLNATQIEEKCPKGSPSNIASIAKQNSIEQLSGELIGHNVDIDIYVPEVASRKKMIAAFQFTATLCPGVKARAGNTAVKLNKSYSKR